MVQKLIVFFYFSVCFFITQKSYASAWVQPKNGGTVIVEAEPYFSCAGWSQKGNLNSQPCFNSFALTGYAEYGVLDWFTFIIAPAFNTYNQSGSVSKFNAGYLTTGGRFQLFRTPGMVLSTSVGYNQRFKSKFFGDPASMGAHQATLSAEQNFLDVRILFGLNETVKENGSSAQINIGTPRTTKSNNWFVDFELAIRPYFSGASDQIRLDFLGGLKFLNQKLVLELHQFNTFTLHSPTTPNEPDYNLFSIRPSMIYWINNSFGLQIGVQQDFFGTNTSLGTAPFGAMWIQI